MNETDKRYKDKKHLKSAGKGLGTTKSSVQAQTEFLMTLPGIAVVTL